MVNIFILVVTYNKMFKGSVTLNCIKKFNKLDNVKQVIVFDNSTSDNDVEEKCKNNHWKYLSEHKNLGISKAYNSAINYIKQKYGLTQNDLLVFLDDDTNISEEYLNLVVQDATRKKDVQIFMPIIKEQNGEIVSPTKYSKIRNIPLKNKDACFKLNSSNILAINSCLTIRTSFFDNYSFDENLFLDYVDSQLFYYIRKNNIKFDVIDYEINHNFFTHGNMDYKKEIFRRKIMTKDYKHFVSDKSITEKILYYFRICFWKLRGAIKFKTIKYFVDF